MMVLKGFLVLIAFMAVPWFLGRVLVERTEKSISLQLLYGYVIAFAAFQILALPCIFAGTSFSFLFYAYVSVIVVLVVAAVYINRSSFRSLCCLPKIRFQKEYVALYVAIALIILQTLVAVCMTHMDLDDSVYVGTATTTLYSDGLFTVDAQTGWDTKGVLPSRYVLSPLPILLAVVSRFTGFHPAVLAHTLVPLFFIPCVYLAFYLIGRKLFHGDKRQTGIFLCLVSLVHIFSYYSVYTQGTFLLVRIWQGKAFLAGVLLPFLFYQCLVIFREKPERKIWIGLACTMTAACLVSSMGIMLAPMELALLALGYAVFQKKWNYCLCAALCCIPSAICAVLYIVIR